VWFNEHWERFAPFRDDLRTIWNEYREKAESQGFVVPKNVTKKQ